MELQTFNLVELQRVSVACIQNCVHLLQTSNNLATLNDLVVTRIDSLISALIEVRRVTNTINWINFAIPILERVVSILSHDFYPPNDIYIFCRGRPKIAIPKSTLEYLPCLKFSAVDIAKIIGVSRDTIFRRFQEHGISVAMSYTVISDMELERIVLEVLAEFPNTGYKRMKGLLLEKGVRVTDQRAREVMRVVDPGGVYARTMSNRAIVRRQYFVEFFNQLWHIDTNLKLIRWKLVIRGCIDGKSRLVSFLEASGDNRAETNFLSFMGAVETQGIPSRTTSDKGRENILIARFMIERRGLNRASHICGKSVHNQRIERFWRDVFYGCTGTYYDIFSEMEEAGHLDIDNPIHLYLLHKVFVPRMNVSLNIFMHAWNSHPLSSEKNYSPNQLSIIHRPPPHHDISLNMVDAEDLEFVCNGYEDLDNFENDEALNNPIIQIMEDDDITPIEMELINQINFHQQSDSHGYDIYLQCLEIVHNYQM